MGWCDETRPTWTTILSMNSKAADQFLLPGKVTGPRDSSYIVGSPIPKRGNHTRARVLGAVSQFCLPGEQPVPGVCADPKFTSPSGCVVAAWESRVLMVSSALATRWLCDQSPFSGSQFPYLSTWEIGPCSGSPSLLPFGVTWGSFFKSSCACTPSSAILTQLVQGGAQRQVYLKKQNEQKKHLPRRLRQ